MQLLDILSADRIAILHGASHEKPTALRVLAGLLARGASTIGAEEVERGLGRREELQSTGVGSGVAIPHASLDGVDRIIGALVVCDDPIDFAAIDGEPVSILFAVIGPKKSTGEHLKTLARISRLLRHDAFRARLIEARTTEEIFQLVADEEGRG